jgi:hypothetical protein
LHTPPVQIDHAGRVIVSGTAAGELPAAPRSLCVAKPFERRSFDAVERAFHVELTC